MYNNDDNRPYIYSDLNRRIWMVQDSEVEYRSVNDANGNPIIIGRAKVGSQESEEKWQLRYLQYDANQSVYSITWPLNDEGVPTLFYQFAWSGSVTATITGITNDNPAVVTANNTFVDGDKVIITGVEGMTQVNYDGTSATIYTVASATATTFELSGVDSSAFGVYSDGGTVKLADFYMQTFG